MNSPAGPRIGRYSLHGKLASGGMATIHLGCTIGAVGFARAVVIKRLHKEYAGNREFVAMFVDEARVAARIRHPNVIPTVDVVSESGELFLVMEYVHGQSLGALIAKAAQDGKVVDPAIVSAVGIGALEGLHAAHEATDERGEPLGIVHRDVSPQNILVGLDGVARVFDFGIAQAETRIHETNHGELKGKMAYMSPEQISGEDLDRRTDVWAAAVVLWEMATRRRLFVGGRATDYLDGILRTPIPLASEYAEIPPALDRAIAKGLERDREKRFATAREFALALEEAVEPSNARAVGAWVEELARGVLEKRAEMVKAVEGASTDPSDVRRELEVLELENAATEVTSQPKDGADVEGEMVTRTTRMESLRGSTPPPPTGSVPPPSATGSVPPPRALEGAGASDAARPQSPSTSSAPAFALADPSAVTVGADDPRGPKRSRTGVLVVAGLVVVLLSGGAFAWTRARAGFASTPGATSSGGATPEASQAAAGAASSAVPAPSVSVVATAPASASGHPSSQPVTAATIVAPAVRSTGRRPGGGPAPRPSVTGAAVGTTPTSTPTSTSLDMDSRK